MEINIACNWLSRGVHIRCPAVLPVPAPLARPAVGWGCRVVGFWALYSDSQLVINTFL
jgi:hypothetical protein